MYEIFKRQQEAVPPPKQKGNKTKSYQENLLGFFYLQYHTLLAYTTATSITLLINTLCIILKINVFSCCWSLHLSISREPLFTKTDQRSSSDVQSCAHQGRSLSHVISLNTVPVAGWGQGLYLCSCIFLEMSCSMLKRLQDNNHSSSKGS